MKMLFPKPGFLKNPIIMTIVKDYQIIKSILGNNNKRYDKVHLSILDQEIFFFYELHFLFATTIEQS